MTTRKGIKTYLAAFKDVLCHVSESMTTRKGIKTGVFGFERIQLCV